jgi:hypothetical protein
MVSSIGTLESKRWIWRRSRYGVSRRAREASTAVKMAWRERPGLLLVFFEVGHTIRVEEALTSLINVIFALGHFLWIKETPHFILLADGAVALRENN